MKMWKRFVKASHRFELFNGFVLGTMLEYASRTALQNTSDFSFSNSDKESIHPIHHSPRSWQYCLSGEWIISRGIVIQNSLRAEIRWSTRGQIYTWFQISYASFELQKSACSSRWRCGIWSQVSRVRRWNESWLVRKIKLFSTRQWFSSRKKCISWIISIFGETRHGLSGFKLSEEFKNLDYYTYSTNKSSLEGHAELNLGDFYWIKFHSFVSLSWMR